jgi:hypothetical protein
MENIKTRQELKKYFEAGDRPTENQFSRLIDGYVHLNELNFGLIAMPTGETFKGFYDFYTADNSINSGAGHRIVRSEEGIPPEYIENYSHVLNREVFYKKLHIKLIGDIDIQQHQPKVIIKRYRQRKKLANGAVRKAGFYKENLNDALLWNRKSEYAVTANEMILDLEPIYYFKPNNENYKDFSPSGTINRPGSFMYSKHRKAFLPIKLQIEILINDVVYRSHPVGLKIILGSAGKTDAINFLMD